MPKCGSCGHQEFTTPGGRTISYEMGAHPDKNDQNKTCLGGILINGSKDPKTGEISWHKPRWKPATD